MRSALRLRGRRGSVILIVLVTILFATMALTVFIEKASNDLLVDAREADAVRLRTEAYSALETTLGVLEDFRQVIGGLRSPNEGWGDPLGFAHYQPAAGRSVDVQFEDESAKISLPNVDGPALVAVFKSWGLPQANAERLSDALLSWMKKDYVPGSANAPRAEDYERAELPFEPAGRSLRSFDELASIDYARTVFYDENGQPNELWHNFVNTFSLYAFAKANINGGNPGALAALGIEDPTQSRRLQDFLRGAGAYQNQGPGYFKNGTDVATLLGGNSPAAQLSTQIAALRIIITVHEGHSAFRLNTVVAPQGGATIPAPPQNTNSGNSTGAVATNQPPGTSNSVTQPPRPQAVPTSTSSNTGAQPKSLNYPFTILEIRENDVAPSVTSVTGA